MLATSVINYTILYKYISIPIIDGRVSETEPILLMNKKRIIILLLYIKYLNLSNILSSLCLVQNIQGSAV
jgi:hypothetical protein